MIYFWCALFLVLLFRSDCNYGKGRIDRGSPAASPFRLRASLAPKSGSGSYSDKSEQQLSANMKVHVKMRQADMPAGPSRLYNGPAYAQNRYDEKLSTAFYVNRIT